MSAKHILITGGSGLIGTHLTAMLQAKGYQVSHLGRSRKNNGIKTFVWDVDRQHIEDGALNGVDVIVHLAGAGIADKRWTAKRKEVIISSRKKSAELLYKVLSTTDHQVRTLVSASGIGYYGMYEDNHHVFKEDDAPGHDYVAEVTKRWEEAVDTIASLGIRTVMLRTGVVLSRDGGALEKMEVPVKWFVGAPLGSGRQQVSWIHMDDLCVQYIKAIEDDNMRGAYNAVAPEVVTNRELTRAIARTLHRPLWLPPVPSFALNMVLGEMASLVLKGSIVSAEKIQRAGFMFAYDTLEKALNDIYKK